MKYILRSTTVVLTLTWSQGVPRLARGIKTAYYKGASGRTNNGQSTIIFSNRESRGFLPKS